MGSNRRRLGVSQAREAPDRPPPPQGNRPARGVAGRQALVSPPGRLSTEVPFSPFEQSLQSERAEILRASKATLTLREELFLELVYRDNRTFEAAGAMVGV